MNNQLATQFNQFMQQMRGYDPNAILNQLIGSGRFSQQQINEAHKRAKSIENQLEGLRKTFGL